MALFIVDEILDVAQGPNYLIPSFTEEVQNLSSPFSFEISAGFLSPQDLFFLTTLMYHSPPFFPTLDPYSSLSIYSLILVGLL